MVINLLWIFAVTLLLLLIIIEDVRYRAVRWWAFPLLAVGFIGIEYKALEYTDVLTNLVFVIIQLAMLSIYFSFKEKKVFNITKKYLGWGDILFWVAACFLFSIPNYLLFFIGSLIFSVFAIVIWKLIMKSNTTTIPLAGLQSIVVLLLLLLSIVSSEFSFRDYRIVERFFIG